MHFIATISILATLSALTSAMSVNNTNADLGINCKGSKRCTKNSDARTLKAFIDSIDPNRQYTPFQHIACSSASVCAYTEKTNTEVSGAFIKKLAHQIPDHGCSACGSVPFGYPGDDDVEKGALTFNHVDNSNGCIGLCEKS